jgi:hypothetical protein
VQCSRTLLYYSVRSAVQPDAALGMEQLPAQSWGRQMQHSRIGLRSWALTGIV